MIVNIKQKQKTKQKNYWLIEFAVPADYRVKLKEREKKDKYLNFARELKKIMEQVSDGGSNRNCCAHFSEQGISAGG